MKRLSFILIAALLLTACGEDEVAEPVIEPKVEEVAAEVTTDESELDTFVEENNAQLDDEGYFVETTDPLEAGDKTNGIVVYNDSGEYFIIKEWYVSEDSDDKGFNAIDFDSFTFNFSVALAENVNEEEVIVLFGETENQTEDEVQFNAEVEIITDNQDQVEFGMGMITRTKPNVKEKGFTVAELEYGTPDEFTMTIQAPLKSVGDEEYEEGHYGDAVELEFSKE